MPVVPRIRKQIPRLRDARVASLIAPSAPPDGDPVVLEEPLPRPRLVGLLLPSEHLVPFAQSVPAAVAPAGPGRHDPAPGDGQEVGVGRREEAPQPGAGRAPRGVGQVVADARDAPELLLRVTPVKTHNSLSKKMLAFQYIL